MMLQVTPQAGKWGFALFSAVRAVGCYITKQPCKEVGFGAVKLFLYKKLHKARHSGGLYKISTDTAHFNVSTVHLANVVKGIQPQFQ